MPRPFPFISASLLFRTIHYILEGRAKDDILRIATYRTLVLSPEERPVVIVLEVIWLAEEQAWSHITRDEREVGSVVPIEHSLRAGSTHSRHEWIVVVWVAAKDPVGSAIDIIPTNDVWEIQISKADGSAKTYHLTTWQLTTTSSSVLTTFCRQNASATSRRQKMLSKSSLNPEAQIFMLQE